MNKITLPIITLFLFCLSNMYSQCWQKIACGAGQTLRIKDNGSLFFWGTSTGTNVATHLGTDTDWNSVYGGWQHSFAKKNNGTLWAWGSNQYGELGIGTTSLTESFIPVQIGVNNDWLMLNGGSRHTMAIKINGTLWTWGSNQNGQLGDGSGIIMKSNPEQIGSGANWMFVSAGGFHSLAIKTDGTLWAWGSNNYGQLGDETLVDKSVPTQIGTDTNWQSISASASNSLALKTDGTLWAWGYNNAGQLGNGTNSFTPNPVVTQVGTDSDWRSISSGTNNSYALKQNGKLYFFGFNGNGQSGSGSNVPTIINNPTQVGMDSNWNKIEAGLAFIMAFKNNGDLYSWGYNASGALGNGNYVSQYSPVLIASCNLATDGFSVNLMKIYPNPTTSILNISNNSFPIDKLIITDLLGKKILEQSSNNSQINVEQLQQGMYVLQIFSDGEVFNNKFVKD